MPFQPAEMKACLQLTYVNRLLRRAHAIQSNSGLWRGENPNGGALWCGLRARAMLLLQYLNE